MLISMWHTIIDVNPLFIYQQLLFETLSISNNALFLSHSKETLKVQRTRQNLKKLKNLV